MKWSTMRVTSFTVIVLLWLPGAIRLPGQSSAPKLAFGSCKPVSERTTDVGCWILIDQPVGRLEQEQVFWHLDVYPFRAEAEKAKGPRSTVVEALGKVWLLTIEKEEWRPAVKGTRIAEIGPLPVTSGEQYSAVFMESISNPGMTSAIHNHSGPEAWYTEAGQTCLETPAGDCSRWPAHVSRSHRRRTAPRADAHSA